MKLVLLVALVLAAASPRSLFHSLDPHSVPQQLAYYELYPHTKEGQQALRRANELLAGPGLSAQAFALDLQPIVNTLAKQRLDTELVLSEEELATIDRLAAHLPNRKLAGHALWDEQELIALPSEDVDLGRGLLITLMDDPQKVRSYEAVLDLMALRVLARVPLDGPANKKIDAINTLFFEEMHLRFPPHSLWAKDVDLYTFLPSVLDSRRGVCLGVCALYLCVAQRVDLPLEIVTPPGHIYVRYKDRNIETTARGIDLPSETYLSIHTHALQERTIKEVIGMSFFNQASTLWQADRIEEAIAAYEKGRPYMPNDQLLLELLACCKLIHGDKAEGLALMKRVVGRQPPWACDRSTLPEDILSGRANAEGISAVFQHVDETRDSILTKQKRLQANLAKYPKFRAGWFALAVTHLQMGRHREAIVVLERLQTLDQEDPTAAYYLSQLCAERLHYPKAWEYLHQAEGLLGAHNYEPKALKGLRLTLSAHSPE